LSPCPTFVFIVSARSKKLTRNPSARHARQAKTNR
jgi:hypothetical protein